MIDYANGLYSLLISLLAGLELLVLVLAAMAYCRYRLLLTSASSVAIGILGTLLLLSLLYQAVFLLGQPWLAWPVELFWWLASLRWLYQHPTALCQLLRASWQCLPRWLHWPVVLVTFYLFLQAWLLPEGNHDSMRYNLARVLLFQQENSLLLTQVTEPHQGVFPVGGDLLYHLFLRWHTDTGVGVFSWLAWLVCICGGYALARTVTQTVIQAPAITTVMVLASLQLPVRQATGSKPDLLCAAIAIGCLLLVWQARQHRQDYRWLLALAVLLSFGFSVKTTFAAFGLPLLLWLSWPVIRIVQAQYRQRRFWLHILACLPMLAVFSQLWLLYHNQHFWGGWSGPDWFVSFHSNEDGAIGALANHLRYWLQAIHLLTPTDLATQAWWDVSISEQLKQVYYQQLHPWLGDAGAAWSSAIMPFHLSDNGIWGDGENGAWFGPLGFLLIIPAILMGLFSRNGWVQLHAWTLTAYWLLVCVAVAWMPWNCRFFSLYFLAAAVPLAWLLQRWHLAIQRGLQVLAVVLLVYAAAANQAKGLLGPQAALATVKLGQPSWALAQDSIWWQTRFGLHRHYFSHRYYGDDRVQTLANHIPAEPPIDIAILSRNLAWLYPYLLAYPQHTFVPLANPDLHLPLPPTTTVSEFDYLLCLNAQCPGQYSGNILWQHQPSQAVWEVPLGQYQRPGALLQLN